MIVPARTHAHAHARTETLRTLEKCGPILYTLYPEAAEATLTLTAGSNQTDRGLQWGADRVCAVWMVAHPDARGWHSTGEYSRTEGET